MTKSNTNLLNSIHGLAAIYIMLGHYLCDLVPSYLRMLLSFGQEVVVVFFVISGYTSYMPYIKHPDISIGDYIKKKAI